MKSVTKILGRLFPFSENIPKHILENARQRGVAVHEWIEKFNDHMVKGSEHPIINLEYQIYADAYKKWYLENEVVPIASELKLSIQDTDEEQGFVGVIDMLCSMKGYDKALVSFKITYDYNLPYCELQESAYNELLLKNGVIDQKIPQFLLHISKNGSTFVQLEDQWEMFKKLKELDEYIDKVELRKKQWKKG